MRGPKPGGAQSAQQASLLGPQRPGTSFYLVPMLLLVAAYCVLVIGCYADASTTEQLVLGPATKASSQYSGAWHKGAGQQHGHIGAQAGPQQQRWRRRPQRPQAAGPPNSGAPQLRYSIGEGGREEEAGGYSRNSVSQQVPEQAAVVVSSSDNSYVSASPVVLGQQKTNTAPPINQTPKHRHQHHHRHHQQQHQQQQLQHQNPALVGAPNVSAQFQCRPATIIKTRESLAAGASFINYTLVTSLNACLVECWITDSCDTAIYQESPVDLSNSLPFEPETETQLEKHRRPRDAALGGQERLSLPIADQQEQQQLDGFYVCYLFQCANSQGFRCQFSAHNYYASATSYQAAPFFEAEKPPTEPDGRILRAQKSVPEASFSKLISSRHWLPVRAPQHFANIHIGRELTDEHRTGLNSALIGLLVGVGATSVLLMIVSHKMESIRRRASGQRRVQQGSTSPQRAAAAVAEAMALVLANQPATCNLHLQPPHQAWPQVAAGGQPAEPIKKATSSVFIEKPRRRCLMSRTTQRISNLLVASTSGMVRLPAL